MLTSVRVAPDRGLQHIGMYVSTIPLSSVVLLSDRRDQSRIANMSNLGYRSKEFRYRGGWAKQSQDEQSRKGVYFSSFI